MRLSSGQPNLWFATLAQREALLEDFAETAARALGEQRVLRTQLHAAGEAILVMPVLGHAHVAGGDACHCAVPIEQHLGGGKARIDFNPQSFRFARKPAADIAERDHVIAMVVHQRRQHDIGQTQGARGRQPVEAIIARLGLDRGLFAAPVRDELVEANRIDDRAREDMRPDFRAFFDHDHREIRRKLLEPDRGGEPGPTRNGACTR